MASNETKRRILIALLSFALGASACPQTHTVTSKPQPCIPGPECEPQPCEPQKCVKMPAEERWSRSISADHPLTDGYDCECWQDSDGVYCDCG